MNEPDLELFEAELRRLHPAQLPAELQARLEQARPQGPSRSSAGPADQAGGGTWWQWLRWLAPAAVAGLVLLGMVARTGLQPGSQPQPAATVGPGLNADQVVIDRTLLHSFDAVATLPDGEPIRLRCRQWLEAVTLRDSARGIEVQQRTPRVEILPMAFETY